MEHRLSTPYCSQWKDVTDSEWKKRACALAALKMVIDQYSVSAPTIDQLIKEGLSENGHDPRIGWKHSVLKTLAAQYGVALDLREYKGLDEQAEDFFKKAVYDIQLSIKENHPILVSITRPSGSSHLVVIVGTKEENGAVLGLYLNDPDDSKTGFGEGYFMDIGEFKDRFRKLSLFSLGKLAK